MLEVVLALGAGAVAGYFNLFKNLGKFIAGPISTVGVVLLLFFMGIKIGSDSDIMSNLAVMGLEALAYAVAAIAGSLLVVWVWQRIMPTKKAGQRESEEV